ncbi:thiamine pyrophosphate-dependent enzyme [Desulfomicrobium salsuginis]
MIDSTIYGEHVTAWCPGCGNHDVLLALKDALARQDLEPHQFALVSGIGQAAKIVHYVRGNGFNGLHGRALPPAQALKLVNPELKVVVESGDGCSYGEGGNHLLAAIRRNLDITLIVHNNQIYGLTKGQASPTTMTGHVTKNNPLGVFDQPFNPVAVAVAMRASFVARSFSGLKEHAAATIAAAMQHKGFSLVDMHSPCISFNKVNTFAWYKSRCKEVSHDPANWDEAMKTAMLFGEEIPIGVIFREQRPSKETLLPQCRDGAMYRRPVDMDKVAAHMLSYA